MSGEHFTEPIAATVPRDGERIGSAEISMRTPPITEDLVAERDALRLDVARLDATIHDLYAELEATKARLAEAEARATRAAS